MKAIRARFKAVVIAVLLLAIILCSAVLYTMETGKTPRVQAGTAPRVPTASQVTATPVNAVVHAPSGAPISTFTVTVDNITDFVYTSNCTVGDVLNAIGFTLGEHDTVEPSLDTVLANGATIDVSTTSYNEVTETVKVPFTTEYLEDEEMYEGEEEIEQYGITGVTVNTYEVKRHERRVESKVLLGTVDESAPQTQIVRYGTMTRDDDDESPSTAEEEEENYSDEEETSEDSDATYEDKAAYTSKEESSEEVENAQPVSEYEETEDAEAVEDAEDAEETIETTITYDGTYQEYAYAQCIARGWTEEDYNALVELWNKESGWNPYAKNPYSGAYGIPQALPGDKMKAYGDDWETNGFVQIEWGLAYISSVYGSPTEAWNYFCKKGWY